MYASVLLKLNQWDDAVSILERVTKASPDVAPTYFSLAEAHIGRSETVPALRSLQRGVSLLDSKNALAWLSRKEFDPMREVPDFQRLVDSLRGVRLSSGDPLWIQSTSLKQGPAGKGLLAPRKSDAALLVRTP